MSTSTALIGSSPAMLAAFRTVARVAASSATVLLHGESGTGKELVARLVHDHSRRRAGPFVAVNCAAIPEPLLESDLFGHEKGSFTGAATQRIGRFERASGGTLFLDEIGDMGLGIQAKILRALEEREVERLGAERPTPVDVRIVAATHRDLAREVRAGRFREDLYYRLAVVVLTLPPLRERGDDIRLLAEDAVARCAVEHGRRAPRLAPETIATLRAHPWPGNVRQLRNAIEHAVLMADGGVVRREHLPPEIRIPSMASLAERTPAPAVESDPSADPPPPRALIPLLELERRQIRRALAMTGGHLARAAETLGIHRNTLRRKLQEHGLHADFGEVRPAASRAEDLGSDPLSHPRAARASAVAERTTSPHLPTPRLATELP